MNRAVLTGTIFNAWNSLASVVGPWGRVVLEAALREATAMEREHRKMHRREVHRVGAGIAARLFILQCAYGVATTPESSVPRSWTAIAATHRAKSLACALGEQIASRKLTEAAFPRLAFAELLYERDILLRTETVQSPSSPPLRLVSSASQ